FLPGISPPGETRIGNRAGIIPIGGRERESEELDVTITKKHVEFVLAARIMPGAHRMVLWTVWPPWPIAGNQFVDRAARHIRSFHRCVRRVCARRVAKDMFGAKRFNRPQAQIAVAPGDISVWNFFREKLWVKSIPFIAGTKERFFRLNV